MPLRNPDEVFVHEKGICESRKVGAGTRIWAFAHVLPGAILGRDCNICDHVFIENEVIVGDRVTVKSGVQLCDGVWLGDGVFVGPNATFTNDRLPRSKRRPERFAETVVEESASVGANATLLPGIRIGRRAMIGAGAVVTKDVPADAIVVGNPAMIIGYQTDLVVGEGKPEPAVPGPAPGSRLGLGIGACALLRLPAFADLRGGLTPVELASDLPFAPRRVFWVYGVAHGVRGEHAHRVCDQLLVAVHGRLTITLDDGTRRRDVILDDPTVGLHLAPMVWGIQHAFEPQTVLLVFASHPYDSSDYIRGYDAFCAVAAAPSG